jgi:gluconate 2-dehydrogenase gamma chain
MKRRDVLKLLGSATALSALPAEALTLLEQASAQAAGSNALKTLDPHQNATVVTISELIIPATDTPGAKEAKVNEFIDLLLSEWFEPAETQAFLAGLADVDKCGKEKFSKAFVDCTPAQQAELMKQFDAEAMEFAAKQKHAVETHSPVPPTNFYYQIKKLTLAGYYTSQIGFSQELGKTIIPPSHAGCAPIPERKSI